MPAPRLVVRCFAASDEGLVDEWPVSVSDDALVKAVPALSKPAARGEIHEVDAKTAAVLAGREIPSYPEEVAFFVEPEKVTIARE